MHQIPYQMASLQLLKSTLLTPASVPRPNLRLAGKSTDGVLRLRVSCKADDGDKLKSGNGEEAPESLFMKELRRRGMSPTSILEEGTKRTEYGSFREEERDFSKRSTVSTTEPGNNLTNQREQSMALNSEGIEGLIPRAKLLLTLGGTFFLAFWPLIIVTVGLTLALYLYFGHTFIHDGSDKQISVPQYIDPYTLLEEERISQIAPPTPRLK